MWEQLHPLSDHLPVPVEQEGISMFCGLQLHSTPLVAGKLLAEKLIRHVA